MTSGSLHLAGATIIVDESARRVTTRYWDGVEITATPQQSPEDIARARALGYDGSDQDALWAMTREHDIAHHLIADAEGQPYSIALRLAALSGPHSPDEREQADREERCVLLLQRASNIGLQALAWSEQPLGRRGEGVKAWLAQRNQMDGGVGDGRKSGD